MYYKEFIIPIFEHIIIRRLLFIRTSLFVFQMDVPNNFSLIDDAYLQDSGIRSIYSNFFLTKKPVTKLSF